ncbi:MAG: enoyl-CoA hydratase/isomerase family protein [Bacteriovoracaceae bacterium]
MSTESVLLVEKSEKIAELVINRPDKLNALNAEVLGLLKKHLEEIHANNKYQVLIVRGEGGKSFVAGADIKEMQAMNEKEAIDFAKLGQRITTLFEELSIPVIAYVDGFALGGGCELAMACDFIYATKKSIFGQPEVKLGLIPGFGGTQRLSRYVPTPMAKELIYSGRNLDATEAKSLGLVNQVFETAEELETALEKCVSSIMKNSPVAISFSKRVINDGVDRLLTEGLEKEVNTFGEIFSSEDMKEGTTAFVEKRKPNFTGR